MKRLKELRKEVFQNLNKYGVLTEVVDDRISIIESKSNSTLREVVISNIPTENVKIWVLDHEYNTESKKGKNTAPINKTGTKKEIETSKDSLRVYGTKVEKTIFFLHENILYFFMIEMKSTLSPAEFSDTHYKFVGSTTYISLFLASLHIGNEDTEVFPVGIICYNGENLSEVNPHSPNQKRFKEHYIDNKERKFDIQFSTILSDTIYTIPVLFFQNDKETASFKIDFATIRQELNKI